MIWCFRKDWDDLTDLIRADVDVHFAENYDQVYKIAFSQDWIMLIHCYAVIFCINCLTFKSCDTPSYLYEQQNHMSTWNNIDWQQDGGYHPCVFRIMISESPSTNQSYNYVNISFWRKIIGNTNFNSRIHKFVNASDWLVLHQIQRIITKKQLQWWILILLNTSSDQLHCACSVLLLFCVLSCSAGVWWSCSIVVDYSRFDDIMFQIF